MICCTNRGLASCCHVKSLKNHIVETHSQSGGIHTLFKVHTASCVVKQFKKPKLPIHLRYLIFLAHLFLSTSPPSPTPIGPQRCFRSLPTPEGNTWLFTVAPERSIVFVIFLLPWPVSWFVLRGQCTALR